MRYYPVTSHEHQPRDPWAWVDKYAPPVILIASIITLGVMVWVL